MRLQVGAWIACVVATACRASPAAEDRSAAATAVARPAQVAPAPPAKTTTPAVAPSCDASDAWFKGDWQNEGSPQKARVAFVKHVGGWTAACRSTAMGEACDGHCYPFIAQMIVDAAADAAETRALVDARLKVNRTSLVAAREALADVEKIVTYAMSIRSSPRASAYLRRGASLDEIVDDLARGNPCIARFKVDIQRIKDLREAIDSHSRTYPEGFVSINAALNAAISCVDCTDDRHGCGEMREPLDGARALVRELEQLNRDDATILARPIRPRAAAR